MIGAKSTGIRAIVAVRYRDTRYAGGTCGVYVMCAIPNHHYASRFDCQDFDGFENLCWVGFLGQAAVPSHDCFKHIEDLKLLQDTSGSYSGLVGDDAELDPPGMKLS